MAKVKLIVFYSAGFVAILATGLRIIFAACGAIVSDPSVSITSICIQAVWRTYFTGFQRLLIFTPLTLCSLLLNLKL